MEEIDAIEPTEETAESEGIAGSGDSAESDDMIGHASELPEVLANEAKRAIEAIVMVTETPADPRLLAQLLELPSVVIDELCVELSEEYTRGGRGFELVKVAGGWRYQSRATQAAYVERFVLEGQSSRLSAAALETLSIVAYKQPISRAQVSSIRGVSVDGVMRTLAQRGYIAELARDPGPGQAMLFGTTSLFLDRLGLNSLDELEPLGDFVPSQEVIEALEAGLRVEDLEPVAPASDDEIPDTPGPLGSETGFAESAEFIEPEVDVTDAVDVTDSIDATDATDAADPIGAADETAPADVAEPEVLDALEVLADEPRGHTDSFGA